MHCRTLHLPKHGSRPEDYEDACAANLDGGRFAMADGASDSAFAALWARMLVTEFVRADNANPLVWEKWLPALQTRWEQEVALRPLSWYAEMHWQKGAFATFLGMVVQPPRWHALAVGDSCLFHTRGHHLLRAFPLVRAADFNTSPWLVGSRGYTESLMALRELRCEGEFQAGDRLWLMTDALAKWFLESTEGGGRPWELLEPLTTSLSADENFARWINALRDSRQLHNDDVTLMGVW